MKATIPLLLATLPIVAIALEAPPISVYFKKVQLTDKYLTEGASIGDINADGKPDLVAGPLWWQGPELEKSFSYAPVKSFPIQGPGLSGYSNNFFTFPHHITQDKWTDILKVGIPGQPSHWAKNPGENPFPNDNTEHQCPHCKGQEHICHESPQLLDIIGDKEKEFLAFSKGHITLGIPSADESKPWTALPITPHDPRRFPTFEHGLGAGDINGDGLMDVLEKRGWWEQPKNWDRETPWTHHAFQFAPRQGGAQMFAYDIDGDGDNDVVTALNAHSWGMAWYEQVKENGAITFKRHTVMTDKPSGNPYGVCFSQPHAMDCVDIDGDGIKDIVTGKCYFAHNGRDPGAHQPAVLYWFRTTRHKDGSAELVPYLIDNDSGVGRQISTGDLNGDGKPDIVVGNKKGVFAFIQTDIPPKKKPVAAVTPSKGFLLEGESLQVTKRTGSVAPQDLTKFGAAWSNHSHVWWTGAKPNDQIEFAFQVPTDGTYRLGAGLTKAIDYGIVEFTLDGKKISPALDLYNNGVIHTGTIALGDTHPLKAGAHKLGVKIVGANPKAIKSYMFGLDYLVLHRGSKEELLKFRNTPAHKPVNARPKGRERIKGGNSLDAKVRSPEEQLKSFKLPEGFTIELVSSELEGTVKPISIAFDDAGRLWTQTARAYPLDKDTAAFENKGPDQIIVFDKPHLDGPIKPRIFADGLSMPVSVLPHDNKVLAIHGPNLISLEDTDGDGFADRNKTLVSGFGIQDTHTTVHQLTRVPGGWISLSQGCNCFGTVSTADGAKVPFNRSLIGRIRPNGTRLEIIGAGMNNIWCWAINKEGRTFIHEANDFGYSQVPFEQDTTYPSFVNSRRYPESMMHPPTAQGLNLGGTGFSGIAISEDSSSRGFPGSWQNVHFVANPITGSINTVAYTVDQKGVYRFEKKEDLVACDDPMFRPVATTFGPDGCLYLIDWYNRIISHNEVRNDHPSRDKISGRIWRVRHASQKRLAPPNVEKASNSVLLRHLASGNLWEMRAAWNQIAKRQASNLIPDLIAGIRSKKTSDSVRIHALWCLESLGHFDLSLWRELLADGNPNLRYEAVRALSILQPSLDQVHQLLSRLAKDPSFRVRNEIARFFRDTPQKLNAKHLAILKSLKIPKNKLPQEKSNGWKGPHLALGGAYESAFLNLLVDKAINRDTPPPPLVDEARWNKTIAVHPPKPAAGQKKVHDRIKSLTASFTSKQGDLARGQIQFQARCSSCHSADGSSGFAPALGGGKGRSIEALLTAILDPNAAAETVFNSYRIVKTDGSTVEGFRSALTPDKVTLTFMGGASLDIPVTEIKDAGYVQGKSVMLENIASGMKDSELNDLITYLRSLK